MASLEQRQNSATFMLRLYQTLVKNGENLFFSPYSISTVMSMVLLGSKENTAKELKSGLGFAGDGCEAALHAENLEVAKKIKEIAKIVTLETANKLFPDSLFPLKEEFVKGCQDLYLSDVENVNFVGEAEQSRQKINAWVDEQTRGKIKDILPDGSVNSNTKLVIANAVYFKGDWKSKFDARNTSSAKFFVDEEHSVPVEMMSRSGKYNINYDQALRVQVVELPYKGEDVSMVILLPTDRYGLSKLEKELTSSRLLELTTQFSNEKIDLSLPKMKLEEKFDAVASLKELGIKDVFDEAKADLSGMSGSKGLFVSNVFHKAFIEVNEEGSEAAAATAAVVMLRAAIMPLRIICDHPFMFLIRHKTSGSILFCGRYVSP